MHRFLRSCATCSRRPGTLTTGARQPETILDVFNLLDGTGDGTIDRQELLTILEGLAPDKWTQERVDCILAEADVYKDNLIQYGEFVSWILKNSELQAEVLDLICGATEASDQLECTISEVAPKQDAAANPEKGIEGARECAMHAINLLRNESGEKTYQCAYCNGTGEQFGGRQCWSCKGTGKEPAIQTLLKILGNIVRAPETPKFRRIQLGNTIMQEKLFSVRGCAELLLAAGFEVVGNELVLPADIDVKWLLDELEAFGNAELMAQRKADQLAAANAAAKADTEKANRRKYHAEAHESLLDKIESERTARADEAINATPAWSVDFIPRGGG